MPIIPRAESQVQQRQLEGGTLSGRANGADFVPESAKVAGVAGDIFKSLAPTIIKANTTSRKELATANARDATFKAMTDMAKLETDMRSRKGQDAVGSIDYFSTESQKIHDTYEKALPDDESKAMFKTYFSDLYRSGLNQAQAHQENAVKEYEKDTIVAHNSALNERAVLYRGDNAQFTDAITQIRQNARALALKNGIKDTPENAELISKAQQDASDLAYKQALNAFIADSPLQAKNFLQAHKDNISPTMYSEFKKTIDKGALDEEVMNKADALSASGLPIDKQLATAEKEKDPDKRDKLVRRIKDAFEQKEQVRNMQDKQIFEGEVDKVFKDPQNYKVPFELDATRQEHLYELQKKLVAEKNGAGKETNWTVYNKLMRMSDDQFQKTDIVQYRKELTGAHMAKFIDMQRSGGRSSADKFVASQSKNYLEKIVNSRDKSEMADQRRALFNGYVQSNIDSWSIEERANKEKVSAFIKEATMPIYDPTFGRTMYRFESYLDTSAETAEKLSESFPAEVAAYPGEKGYDKATERYYVIVGNKARFYNKGGKYLETDNLVAP